MLKKTTNRSGSYGMNGSSSSQLEVPKPKASVGGGDLDDSA